MIRALCQSHKDRISNHQSTRPRSWGFGPWDIAAYARLPVDDHELAVADLPVEFDLGDDDIDYDAIYGVRA